MSESTVPPQAKKGNRRQIGGIRPGAATTPTKEPASSGIVSDGRAGRDLESSRAETRLNRLFQLALAVGALSAVAGAITTVIDPLDRKFSVIFGFAVPILAIVLFVLNGLYIDRFQTRSDTRQKFADSSYFLGFLFTMFALMAGFLPAALSEDELKSPQILRCFGMALGSTAAGLIGRILAIQGGRSIIDDQYRIEAEVQEFAHKISAHAASIEASLAHSRESIVNAQRAALTDILDPLRDTLAAAVGAAAASIESAHQTMLGTIETGTAAIRDGAQAAAESFVVQETAAATLRDSLADAAKRLSSLTIARAEDVAELSAQLQEQQVALAQNATSLAEQVERLTAEIAPLGAMGKAGVEVAIQRLAEAGSALQRIAAQQEAIEHGLGVMADRIGRTDGLFSEAEAEARRAAETTAEWIDQARAGSAQIDRERVAVSADLSQVLTDARHDAAAFSTGLDDAVGRFENIVRDFSRRLSDVRAEVGPR